MSGNINMLGGVNLLDDPRRIRDNEVVSAKNLVPNSKGVVSKRPALVTSDAYSGFDGRPVSALFIPYEGQYQLAAAMRSGSVYPSYLVAADLSGGVILNVLDASSAERPFMFVFNDAVYVLPATTLNAPLIKLADEVWTPVNWAGVGNDVVRPRVACAYRNRVAYGDFGPGLGSYVGMSDDFSPETVGDDWLAADGRVFLLGGNRDGDRVVAMTEIMLTSVGAPAESALLVLKEFSGYVINGELDQSDPGSDPFGELRVNRISFNCGCSSPWSVVTTPYGTIWAAWDDVWLFREGQLPVRIGSKIRPALARTPAHLRYKWTAAYHDGFYRLMVASEDQQVSIASPLMDQWWLDLRSGPPQNAEEAQWWGPQKFIPTTTHGADAGLPGTRIFAQDNRPGRQPILYGLEFHPSSNDNISLGTAALVVYGLPSGLDIPAFGGTASGLGIEMEMLTKEFDAEDPQLDKVFYALEANVFVSKTTELTLQVIGDAGADLDTVTKIVEQTGFVLGVDPLDDTVLARQTQSIAIYPSSETDRPMGKTIQLRLYETEGVTIGENENVLVVQWQPNSTYYFVTIPADRYDNRTLFLDAVVTALEATIPGSNFAHDGTNLPRIYTVDATTWRPVWDLPVSGVTAPQVRVSRLVGALMGFDTSTSPGYDDELIAVGDMFVAETGHVELAGLNVNLNIIPRRPS